MFELGIIFKIESLTFIFKPFILLALLFLYSQSVEFRNKWYAMALIFCFFGDVFLLYSGENVFKFGLGFFLIAHLLFIAVVVKRIKKVNFSNTKILKRTQTYFLFHLTSAYLIKFLIFPSFLCMLVPTFIASFMKPFKGNFEAPISEGKENSKDNY